MRARHMLVFLLVVVAMTAAGRYVMSSPISPATSWQDEAITAIEKVHGSFSDGFHTYLIDGIEQACTMAEEMVPLPDMHDELIRYGFSSDLSISIIAAGLTFRCPEYDDMIEGINA